jgi:hypothetical protein
MRWISVFFGHRILVLRSDDPVRSDIGAGHHVHELPEAKARALKEGET